MLRLSKDLQKDIYLFHKYYRNNYRIEHKQIEMHLQINTNFVNLGNEDIEVLL